MKTAATLPSCSRSSWVKIRGVSAAVKSLTSLIEPIMIAVMGFLVGTIVLAVFLPIFELQKKLSQRG